MQGSEKGERLTKFHWCFAIAMGAIPVIMAIVPLSFSPDPENWQVFVRGNSLIIPLVEFALVLFAMAMGGSVVRGLKSLPMLTRLGLLLWIPVIFYTTYQPGNDFVYATIGVFKIFILSIFTLVLIDICQHRTEAELRFFWICIGAGIQAYFIIFVAYIYANDLKNGQWISSFPGFNNIRHICVLGFLSYCAGMYLYSSSKNEIRSKITTTISIIFGATGLILPLWTGTRAAVLSILIFTLISAFFIKKSWSIIIRYACVVFAIALVVTSALPLPHPDYGILAALGISDLDASTLDGASSGRIELWLGTIQKILEKPIFGWGIEQYSKFNPLGEYQVFHPHNFPLQFVFATGIFGSFMAFVVAVPIILQQIATPSDTIRRFHYAMLIVLGIYALYDGILYFSYSSLIFTMLLISCWRQQPAPDRSD